MCGVYSFQAVLDVTRRSKRTHPAISPHFGRSRNTSSKKTEGFVQKEEVFTNLCTDPKKMASLGPKTDSAWLTLGTIPIKH